MKVDLQAGSSADDTTIENLEGAYLNLANNRIDIGKINRRKNPDAWIEVEFTNSGKIPLLIIKADVSCGCISVEYPKEPILPGQMNIFKIKIDLRVQEGVFNKTLFIKSNAHNDIVLVRVVGEIKK